MAEKNFDFSVSAELKFGANIKEIGWLKKENILVDIKRRHQNIKIENSKLWKKKIYNNTNENQMGQNRSQCLWHNCKKSAKWNRNYI